MAPVLVEGARLAYAWPRLADTVVMISRFALRPAGATLLLAGLLLWAPLPFASVTPVGVLVVRVGCLLALTAAILTVREPTGLRAVAIPAAGLAAIAALGLLQSTAAPRAVARLVSPEHLRLATQASITVGAPEPASVPLSLAPSQSASTAISLAALAGALGAAAVLGGDRRRRRWLLAAFLAAASFQLLYGYRHLAAGALTVWGLEVGRSPDRLRGTFVNSSHLAAYLAMALAVTFALAWWTIRRARRGRRPLEQRVALAAAPVLLWLLLFGSLAFTRSRAGLAAAVLATVTQGVLLAAHRRRWRLLPVGLVAAVIGVGLVAWTGLERGLGRLLGTSAYSIAASARLEVWRGTVALWQRFPWTGTGLGTFEEAFPMVETAELTGVSWQHAHNDWLELLATGGLLGALLAAIGLAALLLRLYRVLVDGRRSETRAAALAALGALVAVGFHELLDFALTLPANGFTLAVLVGTAAAADSGQRWPLKAG